MNTAINPLLLSHRSPLVHLDPFCYFEIDNFLPQDVYKEALAAFPQRDRFPETTEGNKLRLTSVRSPELVKGLMNEHPAWRKVLDWMKAEEFIQDLYKVVRRGLVTSRGLWGARPWAFESPSDSVQSALRLEVRAEFEFSRLEPGAFVIPHTDGPSKLVSALLYFPDPLWEPSYGGDTVYYRAKDGVIADNWRNLRLNQDDLQAFHVNRFAPNRLAVFLKSAHSHHAVDAIQCPPGMARNSLNFNVYANLSPIEQRLTRARMRGLTELSKLRRRVYL